MQFTDKDPAETVRLGVDFANLLDTGETITSASVGIRTAAGVSTAAMLSGTDEIDGSVVRQLITGGVAGTTYKLSFIAVTSTGQTLIEGAELRVSERD
jgi:hypothetical protein